MPDSRVAWLYMVEAHRGFTGMIHRSIVSTLARSRSKVWIPRGRDLAKKVVNNCYTCKKTKKSLMEQQMGTMREEELSVCPPWTYVSLDFAGPILVKGEVNKRSRMKCWILIYCCRSTRAVYLLATPGYSTADFLSKHVEFIARNGSPLTIVSDRGSQMVSAGIVLAEKDKPDVAIDWSKVTTSNSVTNWEFVPVGGQHRNGIPESTVKVMKKSLGLALHPSINLTYSELVTLLAQISQSINSRPLSLQPISISSQQEDVLLPLTPNHLLLARSTPEVRDISFSPDSRFTTRLNYVEEVRKEWWRRWIRDVLPTLLPCNKWRKARRNLQCGDIVFIKYAGNVVDENCLAKILDVTKDTKGLVRTVRVEYRRRDSREKNDVCKRKMNIESVPVQRLVLFLPAEDVESTQSAPFPVSSTPVTSADLPASSSPNVSSTLPTTSPPPSSSPDSITPSSISPN